MILETRSSVGTLHTQPFLDTGEVNHVSQASSSDSDQNQRDAAAVEEYYGLKYRSALGIVSEKVYRYDRRSGTASEAPGVPYDSLGNPVRPT